MTQTILIMCRIKYSNSIIKNTNPGCEKFPKNYQHKTEQERARIS